MTTDLPVYQFSFNPGFGKNGSPKSPFSTRSYGGLDHTVGTLTELIDHAKQMHGWSGLSSKAARGMASTGLHPISWSEFDAVKYPDSDVIDLDRTVRPTLVSKTSRSCPSLQLPTSLRVVTQARVFLSVG